MFVLRSFFFHKSAHTRFAAFVLCVVGVGGGSGGQRFEIGTGNGERQVEQYGFDVQQPGREQCMPHREAEVYVDTSLSCAMTRHKTE